jgi:hypothetical protein
MGRICAQMFQFWRFTNQMMRYKVGLTVADRSLTRNCLAFVGEGNAHTGLQSVTSDRKHDAGAEDARRELHDDRPDDLEQQRGRPLSPVRLAPGVVADEALEDRAGLEGNRAEQQHAEEDVQGKQVADPEDRVALDEQPDQQQHPRSRPAAHCPRPRRSAEQAGVAGGAAARCLSRHPSWPLDGIPAMKSGSLCW